ncbi:hypothetical protein [Actinoalloteichus sp. GBA129-24]|uniref:Uncharacterized protein n=1 Tax=Actinoalloteichus fjordicus TaxID=1612552 RepID=A0AAC9LJK0_9PSEU|nr:hypothetical protein [Actinoalloteichus sp. GBA129-24]APU17919.1 hypothetical protein UA74_29635 [Actinoalloteichus fjordicus]APU23997.1 hypothetical protein UA75_30165 [Actinoalloteichus sp. GBA129-24]
MSPFLPVGLVLVASGLPLTIWGYRPPPPRRRSHVRTVALSSILARLAEERLAVAVGR